MTDVQITDERVLELIAVYGAEPGGWPEAEREAATARMSEAPTLFAEALAEARAIDDLLATETLPEPNQALSDAILASAPRPKLAPRPLFSGFTKLIFPQGVRWPAGAALASLLMGVVGGYSYASTGVGYDQADAAFYTAFGIDSAETWMIEE